MNKWNRENLLETEKSIEFLKDFYDFKNFTGSFYPVEKNEMIFIYFHEGFIKSVIPILELL
jgi:hypothetical protein